MLLLPQLIPMQVLDGNPKNFRVFSPPPSSFLHFYAGSKLVFFYFPGFFQAAVEQSSSSLASSPVLEESLLFQGEFFVDSGHYPRERLEFSPILGAFFFALLEPSWNSLLLLAITRFFFCFFFYGSFQ